MEHFSLGNQKPVKIQYLLLPSPGVICNPHDKKITSLCSHLALVFASWEWWRVEGSWDLLAVSLRWEQKALICTSTKSIMPKKWVIFFERVLSLAVYRATNLRHQHKCYPWTGRETHGRYKNMQHVFLWAISQWLNSVIMTRQGNISWFCTQVEIAALLKQWIPVMLLAGNKAGSSNLVRLLLLWPDLKYILLLCFPSF